MKIEKLNDNQIRCTLSREDLAKRNLRISELAYGSEKTQNLFREMVKQADYEYGFETDNIPLMVEAIPMNSDCLVLIITKVEDPEELDTRFSRFSPYAKPENEEEDLDEDNLIDQIKTASAPATPSFADMLKEVLAQESVVRSFIFVFDSIATAMNFSSQAYNFAGESTLYKKEDGAFLLVISIGKATKAEYKNVCLLASEYASGHSAPDSFCEYMREHLDVLIKEDAIKKLSGH